MSDQHLELESMFFPVKSVDQVQVQLLFLHSSLPQFLRFFPVSAMLNLVLVFQKPVPVMYTVMSQWENFALLQLVGIWSYHMLLALPLYQRHGLLIWIRSLVVNYANLQ